MLEARDLTIGYPREVPLLAEWSHTFDPGRMVAVTGASGRGKSTLLYVLGLMLGPRGGQVIIDGSPTSSMRDSQRAWYRASMFGFVFQDAALDATRTVLDNVTETALYRGTPRRELRATALSLLESFEVDLRAHAKPTQVSGGQAQRIALCRALVHQPRILLADEPTGNLDATSRDVVIDGLRRHAYDGAAVVIVTHDATVAERCDEVVSL